MAAAWSITIRNFPYDFMGLSRQVRRPPFFARSTIKCFERMGQRYFNFSLKNASVNESALWGGDGGPPFCVFVCLEEQNLTILLFFFYT